MNEFTAWIPQRPLTTNTAYKISRSRMYMSEEGKFWKEQAILIIRTQHNKNPREWKGKYLAVSLTFLDSSFLTYDLDGPIKLTLDALSEALDFDDRYVLRLDEVEKTKGPSGVFIKLREMAKDEVGKVEIKWKELLSGEKD